MRNLQFIYLIIFIFEITSHGVAQVGIQVPAPPKTVQFFEDDPQGLAHITIDSTLFKIEYPLFKRIVELDSSGQFVSVSESIAKKEFLLPSIIDLETYINLRLDFDRKSLWKKIVLQQLTPKEERESGAIELEIPIRIKNETFTRIFGSDKIGLKVTGNISFDLSGRSEKRSGAATSAAQDRGTFSPRFNQTQQFTIEGKIGEKVTVSVEQNSEATFDFENTLKLRYKGDEDEIIQSIEAGNIGLSLPSTKYVIFGGSNKGLFGIKTDLKVGDFYFTGIASLEKGEQQKLTISGSATESKEIIRDYEFIKNRYFFIDTYYRDYFENGIDSSETVFIYVKGTRITDFDVFKSTGYADPDGRMGIATINPADPLYQNATISFASTIDTDKGVVEKSTFKRLEKGIDYDYNDAAGFFWLRQQYQNDIIAVAYKTENGTKVGTLFSEIVSDTSRAYVLRLIQTSNLNPTEHKKIWPLMMRNVYFLGGTGIEEEGFDVRIEKNIGSEHEEIQQVGEKKSYLNLLGLDRRNENGGVSEDGDNKIDSHGLLVNRNEGILIFPGLQPFNPFDGSKFKIADTNRVDIYETASQSDMNARKKFEIIVTSKSTKSSFSLGFNILEGSEEVLLNGQPLKRDTDYLIDYFTGQLTLISPEAMRSSSSIEIKYEKATIFQLDKKTILGGRGEYRFWEDSFIGLTALYMKKSTLDQRVRVGQEPFSNFVWDINTALKFKPRFLTKWVDALPLVETNAPSSFQVEAEFAQVLPDPNTLDNEKTGDNNGVAYIDDFESTKRTTTLGIRNQIWTPSSPPKVFNFSNGDTTVIDTVADKSRGKILWYNPYEQVRIEHIWPERDVNTQTGQTTDVLDLRVERSEDQDPDKTWVGIMRSTLSFANQQKTKFIELWIKEVNSGSNHVRINIDIGQMSEDWYMKTERNGRLVYGSPSWRGLNHEDKNKNGYLDEGEDTGIDGIPSGDPGDTILDDWKQPDQSNGSYSYEGINGTEGNSDARGSIYPDTEDLNGNGQIDPINEYFEYSFSLDENDPNYKKWLNGKSKYKNTETYTGWQQIRIPLNEYIRKIGNPDTTFQSVYFVRLWLDNLTTEPQIISIATFDFVGSEWEEDGIAQNNSDKFIKDYKLFSITVYNTDENGGLPAEYKSPPGVEGVVDRITKARSKEQSMVLKTTDLKPGEKAQARKPLVGEVLSLLNYKRLKMFIYGKSLKHGSPYIDLPATSADTSKINIYLKFGADDNNYYEYGQMIYQGWYKENEIDIDLAEMARTKNLENKMKYLPDKPGGYYKVAGNPSLESIRYFKFGVWNRHNTADEDSLFDGEIWIDEMRLSDVRKESGTALRLGTSLSLADLLSFSAQWESKDADFHDIKTQFGSGNTNESQSYSGKLNFDKFLPNDWNLSIPVDARYSSSTNIPKYIPRTDILTDYNNNTVVKKLKSLFGLRKLSSELDTLVTKSEVFGIGTTIKKRSRSNAWYFYYTIDQISFDFDYSYKTSRDYRTEYNNSESWKETISYGIPFEKTNYIEPFKFFENTPVLNILSDQKLYYSPSSTNMNLTVTDVKSKNKLRQNDKITSTINTNSTRSINIGYQLLPSINLNYSRTHKADADYDNLKGSELLKSIITKFDFGKDTDINQNFQANYRPSFFSWLTNEYTYISSFNYRYTNLVTDQKQSNSSISRIASLSFSPNKLANLIYTPKQEKSPQSSTAGRRPSRQQDKKSEKDDDDDKEKNDNPEEDEAEKKSKFPNPLLLFYKFFDAWNNIKTTYKWDQNFTNAFVSDIPSWKYQFGLTSDPGVPQDTSITKAIIGPAISDSRSLSTSTTFNIAKNISATFNHAYDIKETRSDKTKSGSESITYFASGDDPSSDFKGIGRGFRCFVPDWSINISQLQDFLFFKSIAQSMSIDHSRTGKYNVTKTLSQDNNTLIPDAQTFSHSYQPLIGINIAWLLGISTNIRYNKMSSLSLRANGGASKNESKSFSITASYATSGGFEIPIPIWPFKGHKFQNEMNLSITFDSSVNKTFQKHIDQNEFQENQNNESWKLRPSATYRFSKRVSGSLFYEMGVTNNKISGEYSYNEFGITCNIAIRD